MKYIIALSLMILVGCGSAGSTQSTDSSNDGKSKSPFDHWPSQHREMVEVLDMDESESDRLKAVFEEHVAIYDAWNEENGEEYRKEFNESKNILSKSRSEKIRYLNNKNSKGKTLRAEFLEIVAKQERDVLKSLSKEDRAKWQGHLIFKHFANLTESMTFSDDQQKQLRQIASQAAGAAAKESNPLAAGFIQFEKQLERQVLNQEQRQEYSKIKDKNKFRTLSIKSW